MLSELVDAASQRVVGAHMLGPDAGRYAGKSFALLLDRCIYL